MLFPCPCPFPFPSSLQLCNIFYKANCYFIDVGKFPYTSIIPSTRPTKKRGSLQKSPNHLYKQGPDWYTKKEIRDRRLLLTCIN